MLEADPAQQTVNSAAKRMSDTSRLAAAVTSKIEAGNLKISRQLFGLSALKTHQHLIHRRTPCDPRGNSRFQPVQVSNTDVHEALRSFPAGSSGGPDGLTPQHILRLLTGATDNNLESALVDW